MSRFVPVTDSERPLSEQAPDSEEFAAHRRFDNPHTVTKGKTDRGWEQGDVGWGVVKSFGGDDRDSGAQVAKHAEGSHKMVRNEKGLWVKAKTADDSTESQPTDSNERVGGGRGKGGISVVDKFLGDQLGRSEVDHKQRHSKDDDERFKDRHSDHGDGGKDSRRHGKEDEGRGRAKSRRDDEEDSGRRKDRRSQSRECRAGGKDHKRRQRSISSSSASSRSRSRSRSPRHKKSSRRDRSESRDNRYRRRSPSKDRRRDRDSRDRTKDRGSDKKYNNDNRNKRDDSRPRRQSTRDTSESRDRRKQHRSDSRGKDRHRGSQPDRDSSNQKDKAHDLSTKQAVDTKSFPREIEDTNEPMFITAIQVVNRFQEVFANHKATPASRLRSLAELFDEAATINSLKDHQKVYIHGKDNVVKSFEATTAATVQVSKRIFVEHNDVKTHPNTFCLDLHRVALAPGLGDPSKENALLYHCSGSAIAKVWGMVDSAHLADDRDLAENVLFQSAVWTKACAVIASIWFGKTDEESLKVVRACAHYHNYDHMEVWG